MTINYKYGFTHNGKQYGWVKNELHRLPQTIGTKFYGLKVCKPWNDGFYLGSDRKSKAQLESMTVVINKEISLIKDGEK